MKKTIFTIAGSALIALTAVQFAAAAEPHHVRHHQRAASEFRDSNAFVAPAYEAAPEWSRYSGGAILAPAGR